MTTGLEKIIYLTTFCVFSWAMDVCAAPSFRLCRNNNSNVVRATTRCNGNETRLRTLYDIRGDQGEPKLIAVVRFSGSGFLRGTLQGIHGGAIGIQHLNSGSYLISLDGQFEGIAEADSVQTRKQIMVLSSANADTDEDDQTYAVANSAVTYASSTHIEITVTTWISNSYTPGDMGGGTIAVYWDEVPMG